jgi:hypothetical protein
LKIAANFDKLNQQPLTEPLEYERIIRQNLDRNRMKKIILILAMTFIFGACEDPAPVDIYEPKYVLEALLFVDEPIEGITLIKTQPLIEEFNIDSAQVRDASIIIRGDGRNSICDFAHGRTGKPVITPRTVTTS